MPSNVYQGRTVFDNNSIPDILYSPEGLRSPRGITMDPNFVPTNPDGAKLLIPGMLISRMNSGLGRIFPASRIVSGTSGQTTIVVRNASVFAVGDTVGSAADLTAAATARGTITALNLATNTVTVDTALGANLTAGHILRGTAAANGTANTSILGMVVTPIDILDSPNDVGVYTACSIFGARLTFWAPEIAALFPEITLQPHAASFPVT